MNKLVNRVGLLTQLRGSRAGIRHTAKVKSCSHMRRKFAGIEQQDRV